MHELFNARYLNVGSKVRRLERWKERRGGGGDGRQRSVAMEILTKVTEESEQGSSSIRFVVVVALLL